MNEKPYQGLTTFLKAGQNDLTRQIGVFGVPFDGATSYAPGARFAPNAIRQASMMLTDGDHPLFETNPASAVTDLGDIVTGMDVARSLDQISNAIEAHPFYAQGKPLMFMGGDHTVSLGIIRAMSKRSPGLHIIHFDAHCDTWETHFGEPIGHGTWVRNVVDEGCVPAASIMSLGLRSPVDPATRDWLTNAGGKCFGSRSCLNMGAAKVTSLIREEVGRAPVYLSFDIDAFDPAYAPGTGTPEVAGLTPHFVLDVLESLHGVDFVGMDVVEVNPQIDLGQQTALLGATLLWTMCSMLMCVAAGRSAA